MKHRELIKQYGSPAYIYNLEKIEQAYRELLNAIPESGHVYYSLKANPHPVIVKHLLEIGCKAEISSSGELLTALKSGANPEDCLYTGPGKTEYELEFALSHGILYFSVESWNEALKLATLAEHNKTCVKAILRINPSFIPNGSGLMMTGIPSQFGIDQDMLDTIPVILEKNLHFSIIGFHLYTGSNIIDPDNLLATLTNSIQVASMLSRKLNIKVELLDLGGGFGLPYAKRGKRPDFSAIKLHLESCLDHEFPEWRKGAPQIYFESGRYLVGESGTFITSVTDIKTSMDKKFYVMDSGIHHLGGMSGLGKIPRVGIDFLRDSAQDEILAQKVSIVGPLCTPLDILAREIDLPEMESGDILVVPNVGAYGLTASLIAFLSRDAPVEIVHHNGKIVDVSQLIQLRVNK